VMGAVNEIALEISKADAAKDRQKVN